MINKQNMRTNTMKIQDQTEWTDKTGLKIDILMELIDKQLEESHGILFLCMITAVYFMYKDGNIWHYPKWRNSWWKWWNLLRWLSWLILNREKKISMFTGDWKPLYTFCEKQKKWTWLMILMIREAIL